MSEPFSRPRHDRGGYDAQEQTPGVTREDPLAELARLVGKDDPFRALARRPGSNVAPFPQTAPAQPADRFASEHEDFRNFDPEHRPDFDAQLRGSLDARHHDPAQDDLHFPPVENEVEAFEPALGYPAAGGRGEAPTLNADLWAEGALPQSGPTGDLFQEQPRDAADNRTPRRTLVVLAAVLALTVGGLGATFLMRDGSGVHLGSGTPPTIMAADTPVKVQSPDVSGGNSPDGNTALLEKTGSDKVDNAKVVTNNEQPVDLNQLPKTASGQADAPALAGSSPSPFPEPRKVKTVLIRPDGSVVGEAPQAAPASQPVGMVLPTEAGGPAQAAQPVPTEPVAKPSTPKSTARASATPTSPAAAASGAKSAATAPHPPKPTALASAASDNAAPTPATSPGTWSVQLGAPPSEQEAKDMSSRMQKKFAGELGGLRPGIVKADKDGKPIYRVRVGSLAQADAKALCTKLQGNGGSCFVVRN